MTIIYICRWSCEQCSHQESQENELSDIYEGKVKCPQCKVKMMLINIRRKI